MSVRNLEFLLRPHRVALVGASATPGTVGAALARNLLEFRGELYFVNPKHAGHGSNAGRLIQVIVIPSIPPHIFTVGIGAPRRKVSCYGYCNLSDGDCGQKPAAHAGAGAGCGPSA